ncbi:ABC transporter permease [Verminephrobacter eiseniae]|uniref:ABC transporter permease n=1 Tax=Verminephrobacter eiseniae TaxID=364317 RepID=UPI002239097C|nr:ABC transporter permease [Verminephrobacter eiseniae]MCW5230618.1 ABC transporter permease [Verminephrobacter eiseniae]MCW5292351.1 ABC transporter permease [Verminephrobacter eiseniae]MCW8183361.1 ABC transporter permease [Verminephrobacter eiseniae]MCW8223071.1 ABC transporter permease [Verminephrobacter eiseniae]MCW8234336.1 ABC transporter permease [Verminephrobacter eiseniae]
MVAQRKLMASPVVPVLLSIAVLLAVWQGAIVLLRIPPFVLPSLGAIVQHAFADTGRLMAALLVTLGEALGGYALGSMLGLSLAVALLLVAPLERVVMPLAVALNAVPTVAYAPLFLIWFGLGAASKIALVALAVGFTMLVNALHGLKQTDSAAVDLMRSFGAGRLKIVWRLRLPVALPSVVTALRISVPRSVIVAIVGEMLGAYAGLGRMIYESTQQVDLLSVWSAVLVASAASMVFYGLLVWIDQKLVWWR